MEVYPFVHDQLLPEYQVVLLYPKGEYVYDHSLLEVPRCHWNLFPQVSSIPLGHQQSLPQSRIISVGRFSFRDPEILTAPPPHC